MSEEIDYSVFYQPKRTVYVIKKDGSKEAFNVQKVITAVGKSAYRALTKFTDAEKRRICQDVIDKVDEMEADKIPIQVMHNIVESALEDVKPVVAKSYRDYRNYKQDFVRMMDDVYKKSQSIMYVGDKENANTDSALVSTKRSLIFNQFNKELYQKFFLTTEEIQACRDGYIYIHDMSARRDTMNCCLFDVDNVLSGGFEMGNIWYNEPKSLDVAFDVIGDIVLSAASQQYGGFTVPEENLPFTIRAEYSFEGQNWMLFEEQRVTTVDAGFYIACKREQDDEESPFNIYIRLQWNNNGTEYFSNVLCYAADDLDSEEDIGGSRGGGTSITNPPDEPQEEPCTDTDRENGSEGDNRKPPAGKDQTHGGDGGSGQTASDRGGSDEALSITDHSGADMDQRFHAESSGGNTGQAPYAGSADGSEKRPQQAESAQTGGIFHSETEEDGNPGDSGIPEKEEAVPALSGYEAEGDGFPQISERALRAENRRVNYMAAAAGFVLLSAFAGAAVCYAHFRSGTKR